MKALQAIRGMNDILPEEIRPWQHVEHTARTILLGYGFQEMRTPVLERTELFRRSIGEVTDIVEKEMYTFADRNAVSLTLRPECTASCVRAAIQHSMVRGGVQRLWTMGPMFRYEKPQKGRYRQFHQIDAEIFGVAGPEADAELILLAERLWKGLGLSGLELELNSLGTREVQSRYRDRLVRHFGEHRGQLDEDARRRLGSNPLRILDSKNPRMREVIETAPRLIDELDDASRRHFETLCEILDRAGVSFRVNSRLVRGLDYYTHSVFEWLTDELGAQGAVCGGGRYDGLFGDIGGADTPAVGFAIGMERLVALLRARGLVPAGIPPHCYLLAVGGEAMLAAHALAEELREAVPGLRMTVDAGEGGFRTKLKRADRSGADYALLLGEDEVRGGSVNIKPLRDDAGQFAVGTGELGAWLNTHAPVTGAN